MKTELPKEELNLIAQIDARLKKLEQFMADVIGTPIAPIEQVEEVKYVRCVISVLVFTEGHIYKLSSVSANNIEPFVMYNGIQHCSYEQYRMFFFPATEAEYLSQQEHPKSIVKEEVKERWKPSYGCKYWYIGSNDGQFFVSDFHWGNDDVDFINHNNSNCFKTKEEAQSAAEKIKALLATI